MKIRSITIENFRKFRASVTLSGFGDGLNLICEPNEFGKSTILAAMRAALFERHGSKSETIRRFKPHGDSGAPRIDLTFEIGGRRWRVRKSFLVAPKAILEGEGGELFRGDEAEERLQALLGAGAGGTRGSTDDSRGVLGMLWVEQGGSASLGAPGEVARRTLHGVLEGEVGVVTGGQRTAAVMKSVDATLSTLLTATGRPTGALLGAESAATAAATESDAAAAEAVRFERTLDELAARRRDLAEVMRDLSDPEDARALERIAGQMALAQSAAGRAREAALRWENATERGRRAAERATGRLTQRDALAEAVRALTLLEERAGEAEAVLAEARAAEVVARAEKVDTAEALARAESGRESAFRDSLAAEETRAWRAAFGRRDEAGALVLRIQELDAGLAANPMTPDAAKAVATLSDAALKARSALEAASPVLRLDLLDDALEVRIDGEPVRGALQRSVTAPAAIDIAGVGRLLVTPAAGGEAGAARLRSAEGALRAFLDKVGQPDEDGARRAAETRRDAEAALREVRAALDRLCPADPVLGIEPGLPALAAALLNRTQPDAAAADAPSLAMALALAEAALVEARAADHRAGSGQEAAVLRLVKADSAAGSARTGRDAARIAADRLGAALARDEAAAPQAALDAELAAATRQEADALLQKGATQRDADDLKLPDLEKEKRRIETRRTRLTEDRFELSNTIASLQTDAKIMGQEGPFQRAAAAREEAARTAAVAARLRREADVLSLLKTTIADAQREARQRFLLPITRRVEPYIQRLLPAATITFDEALRPSAISRAGQSEDAETLSIGTQEQIAILTRIAFAELLIDKGKPASLLLDDALVFADDQRFDTMTEILMEAGRRMQVIVLSCRRRAYLGVEAHTVRLADGP